MPLPFVAGLALGSVAMLAFTKRKVLKKELSAGAEKAKVLVTEGVEKSKQKYEEIKEDIQKRYKTKTSAKAPKKAAPKKSPAKPRAKKSEAAAENPEVKS